MERRCVRGWNTVLEPRVTISAVVGDSTGPESKGKQPIDYIGKKKKGLMGYLMRIIIPGNSLIFAADQWT